MSTENHTSDSTTGNAAAGGSETGASPEAPPPPSRRIPAWAVKSWRWIHIKFPNAISSPHKGEREYFRKRDAEDNVDTRVPVEEELRVSAVWGAEIYGPSEIDRLYSALRLLGWNDSLLRGPSTGPVHWIAEQRMYGSEGTFNIGVVQRRGEKRFLARDYSAPMPREVDYLYAQIFQLSPSVTCIAVCFVLKDGFSNNYETELNTDRTTTKESIKSGYRIHGVEHLKRQAIAQARTEYRNIALRWFAANLPGFFCLGTDGNRLPTAELLTNNSELLLPTQVETARREPKWVHLLGNYRYFNVWTSADCAGLSICLDEFEGEARFHTVVNLRTKHLSDNHLKYLGDRGTHSFVAFVDQKVDGILAHYAAIAMLREAVRTLRLTRDKLTTHTHSHRQVLKALDGIKQFFDKSVGLPTITAELLKKSDHDNSYHWYCGDFFDTPLKIDDKPTKIAEALRFRTHHLATRTLSQEKETRDHLQQISTILSTQESVRAQRRMEIVTVAATILAAASLFVALMSGDRFSKAVIDILAKL